MAYICFSDFIEQTMPDERDIYVLFKAIVNVFHNSGNKDDISVNIENIEYDRDKESIRFIKCRKDKDNIIKEIRELITFLVSRLSYGDERAYMFAADIKKSFECDRIGGIYKVLSEYEKKTEEEGKIFTLYELIFAACIIIVQILYYKITGISFFM